MDYEKKYKEALERAKKFYANAQEAGNYNAVARFENMFPELRESEDENLKNKSGYYKAGKFWKASTLWNAVKGKSPQRVPNRYILQDCTWNIGTLQHFANEVKNVQEVNLDYPIILDMNGNILDGAHRVVKAYLEGKDIDIVYLGDDEWPEPDYDEEKAVAESEDERMINELKGFLDCFGADYFGTGQWQRYHTWLEKQKEKSEKPIIPEKENEVMEAIEGTIRVYGKTQGEWIAGYDMDTLVVHLRKAFAALEKQKESLHITETCKENADSFTDEDERIRKSLVEYFSKFNPADMWDDNFSFSQILAHLEKQKEPIDPFDTKLFQDGVKEGRRLEREDIKKERKSAENDGEELLYVSNKSYKIGYRDGKRDAEQKPAEWSEEDEDKLTDVLEMIKYTDALPPTDIPSCTGHLHLSNEYKEKLSSWLKNQLKSLRTHWKPSEEQMEALQIATMESKTDFETLTSLLVELKKLT